MKKLLVWLLFLATLSVSCSPFKATNLAYAASLEKSQPQLSGSAYDVELEYYFAKVYGHGVKMRSKSGDIYPLQVNVYDVNKAGTYDTVYARSGPANSWQVYRNYVPVPGMATSPETLNEVDGLRYLNWAYQAQGKRSRPVITPKPASVQKEPYQTACLYGIYDANSDTPQRYTPLSKR